MLVLVFATAAFVNGYLDHRPPTVWCQLLHSRRMEWQVSGLVSEIQFIQIVVVTKCHVANYPKTQYLRIIAIYAQESIGSARLAPPRAAHLCVPVCSMRLSSALDKWASLGCALVRAQRVVVHQGVLLMTGLGNGTLMFLSTFFWPKQVKYKVQVQRTGKYLPLPMKQRQR